MVASKCSVKGCKTGYVSDMKKREAQGLKRLSLFSPPRDEDLFQKWKRAIPKSDREFQRKDKVCELHFLPEEISGHYKPVIINGIEEILEKGKKRLVTDAVPSVFPSFPSYYTKKIRKRKPPVKRLPLPSLKKPKVENILPEDIGAVDDAMPQFPVNTLIENLCYVRTPNKFWSVSSHEDFIVCAKWDANFAPERQIVIDADLGFKIMYYGSISSTKLGSTLNTIDSLSELIMKVDLCELCSGALDGSDNCSLYLERNWGACGRPQTWCSACRNDTSVVHVMKRNPELALKDKSLNQQITSSNEKNAHLKVKGKSTETKMDMQVDNASSQE